LQADAGKCNNMVKHYNSLPNNPSIQEKEDYGSAARYGKQPVDVGFSCEDEKGELIQSIKS
jgi:hypothetical protein